MSAHEDDAGTPTSSDGSGGGSGGSPRVRPIAFRGSTYLGLAAATLAVYAVFAVLVVLLG